MSDADAASAAPASTAPIVILDTNALLDWRVFKDPTAQPIAEAITSPAVQTPRQMQALNEVNLPAMRAVAENRVVAQLMGIRVQRLYILVFGLGSGKGYGACAKAEFDWFPDAAKLAKHFQECVRKNSL